MANERRPKEARNLQKSNEKPNHPIYAHGCDSNDQDDEGKMFILLSLYVPLLINLVLVVLDWQYKIKFTFDVAKCNDEFLKNVNIRLSHAISVLDELKWHAYCKWHNSLPHAIDDCNVFWRQIQSAVNEGIFVLQQMQIAQNPFQCMLFYCKVPKY